MEMPGCMCLHYVQMLRPGIFFCLFSESCGSVRCAVPGIASPREDDCGRAQMCLRGLAIINACVCVTSMQHVYNNL